MTKPVKRVNRRPKTNKVPRTRNSGRWTEAAFWGFLRSGLRRMSMRWQPISDVRKAGRRPNQSANRRLKYEHQCSQCLNWFPEKEIEIDHIDGVGSGQLRSWEDFARFAERLFCEIDRLRKLCVKCNQANKYNHSKNG